MNPPEQPRRLWGIGTARTFRPHWMLAELDLEYETKEIITRTETMMDPAFRALSERGKIPLYEEGSLMIGESGAIVLHLVDRYRGHGSQPAFAPEPGTDDRARHDELCFFVMAEMDAPLYIIRRHGGLPDIYGESPVAIESAQAYFLRSATEIERRLADGRRFLLGDTMTAADMLLKTCLDWSAFVQIPLPESLAAYSKSMAGRAAYGTAWRKNFTPAALAALSATSP